MTSPSSLTSHLSPQQKSAAVKKRVMIDSPLCSKGHFFPGPVLFLAAVTTPTLCWVAQGHLRFVNLWLLADLVGSLLEAANNTGPPLKDPPPLVVARGIHLTPGEE